MTMLSINTNVGALNAAQASYSVNKSMETSMARLSSGKRINTSADDAAGAQIARRLTAEIQGLNQAVRNAADSQALLATAEGSMDEIHTILIRLRELAVQASNGTNSAADRDFLQHEADALEAEIQRIADDSTWAGIQILDDGLASGLTMQVGARAGDVIYHSIPTFSVANGAVLGIAAGEGISTVTLAQAYITEMDNTISNVGVERAQLAAVMNRLDHSMANLANQATHLSTAKGRIEDADFAAETANLARTQVLQQASMSMLAQANASKQNILALFQ